MGLHNKNQKANSSFKYAHAHFKIDISLYFKGKRKAGEKRGREAGKREGKRGKKKTHGLSLQGMRWGGDECPFPQGAALHWLCQDSPHLCLHISLVPER